MTSKTTNKFSPAHAGFVLDALEQALHDRRPVIAAGSCIIATEAANADSNGHRNALKSEIAMSIQKRRSARSGRAPLPSPGRPQVAGREQQSRFWRGITAGLSSEDAALEAGVSQPVGTRLFRKAGG